MAKFESVFSSSPVPQPEQALVSALVIVADWIASNSDLFPLDSCIGSYDEFIKRTDAAWASLALPPAWQAMPVKEEGQELYHHRFIGLPEDASLRPAQEQAMQAASDMDGAGLLIIEAPMGNGKTEAALMCSEIMAPKTGAGESPIFYRQWQLPTRCSSALKIGSSAFPIRGAAVRSRCNFCIARRL